MSREIEYIRQRAAKLRLKAEIRLDPDVRADYTSGARYLELVADELANEMHIKDEEE